MKKLFLFIIFTLLLPFSVWAQEVESGAIQELPPDTFFVTKVLTILDEKEIEFSEQKFPYQKVLVQVIKGEEKNQIFTVEHGSAGTITEEQKVKVGQKVVVAKSYQADSSINYYIVDEYRLPGIYFFVFLFIAIVYLMARKKGLMSIIGLAVSILILTSFVIPQVLAGKNPVIICLIGSLVISFVAMFLSHGFNKRTLIAYLSTIITFLFAAILAKVAVLVTHLSGLGTEEAIFIQFGSDLIDAKGLLLGGIIIGTLGILDDITTAQVAIVDELKAVNHDLKIQDLYKRGVSVGKEHIAALVNTLALAYAGASLPLILLFYQSQSSPLWMVLNSEMISEEIIRTLVGSITLVVAVPISTLFAAYYIGKYGHTSSTSGHTHSH